MDEKTWTFLPKGLPLTNSPDEGPKDEMSRSFSLYSGQFFYHI